MAKTKKIPDPGRSKTKTITPKGAKIYEENYKTDVSAGSPRVYYGSNLLNRKK